MPAKLIDITGQRFGRLVAVDYHSSAKGGSRWRARCDCGKITLTLAAEMKNGRVQSCGCLRSESFTSNVLRAKKGGSKGSAADVRRRALAEIFGTTEPREIDRQHKTWRGAEDAAASLGNCWK